MQVQSEQGYVPTRLRKQKQGQGVPKSKTKEYSYTKRVGKKKGKKYNIKDYKPGGVRSHETTDPEKHKDISDELNKNHRPKILHAIQ
jgi:hypothetical protein